MSLACEDFTGECIQVTDLSATIRFIGDYARLITARRVCMLTNRYRYWYRVVAILSSSNRPHIIVN